MKREYMKPAMVVVQLQHQGIICMSDIIVTRTAGNADLYYEGGSNGPARVRSSSGIDWDEWE